jgi:hypothetical protein
MNAAHGWSEIEFARRLIVLAGSQVNRSAESGRLEDIIVGNDCDYERHAFRQPSLSSTQLIVIDGMAWSIMVECRKFVKALQRDGNSR